MTVNKFKYDTKKLFDQYVIALSVIHAAALMGARCAWITQGKERFRLMWHRVFEFCSTIDNSGAVERLGQERALRFKIGGGYVRIIDSDNIDRLRGDALDVVIVDESVAVSDTLNYVIFPSIMDKLGRVFFLSKYDHDHMDLSGMRLKVDVVGMYPHD